MKEKKVVAISFVLFLVVVGLLNFFSFHYLGISLFPTTMTGYVIDSGDISLYVEGGPLIVIIHYPENTTYTRAIGDNYLFNLNVSADFSTDSWKYSLYDTRHSAYVSQDIPFTPNSTFTAVRWGNRLTVYAHKTDADWVSEDVYFTVSVPNSAPLLGEVDDYVYVCEGRALDKRFNASDSDEDYLYVDVSPKNPFYAAYLGKSGYNISLFKLYSGTLGKSHVGSRLLTLSVNDRYNASCCVDTTTTNVTVIEVNNEPVLTGLGAQTVYLSGSGNSFQHQLVATDTEDGSITLGVLGVNLSWSGNENLFDINDTGYMNYTPLAGHIGVYSLSVCVNDTALSNAHENISLCSVGAASHSVCDDFTLTVTNDNRAPVISAYSPLSSNLSFEGTTAQTFSVNVTDADGTIPDIDWYVDGVLNESNEGKSYDAYSLLFGCGIYGTHNVSAVVSDGLATATQFWNLSISVVACQTPSSPGGGDSSGDGGGGGGALGGTCNEKWVCNDWGVCQSSKRSFDAKSLSPEDYYLIRELCSQNEYDERFCGFQVTDCFDLAACNNSVSNVPKPREIQVCYFTENPNCFDEITNCHSDGCELLVDCGGPCKPCPTCSDKIQNQGESGADCGGPCPYVCEKEKPLSEISYVLIGLLVLLVIVVMFIVYKFVVIVRYRRGSGRKGKKE